MCHNLLLSNSLELGLVDIGLVSPLRLQLQPRHDPLQSVFAVSNSRQVSGGKGLKWIRGSLSVQSSGLLTNSQNRPNTKYIQFMRNV